MATDSGKSTLRRRVDRFKRNIRDAQGTERRHGEMARNFAKCMLLLGVAMLAAMYANSAAREGRVFTASIAALIAMAIALWVGVRFVPPLAAGVDWDWLPFFTRYQLTREGWIFIAASLVVTSAAINTGNNLLYMVLSALLAVLILSGLLSGLNFRFLRVTAHIPDHCFAKQPFPMAVSIRNPKRLFPTFSIEVRRVEGSPFEFARYYLPLLEPGTQTTRTVTTLVGSRGRFDLNEVRIRSRYPFGFLSKARSFPVDSGIIVFPELLPLESIDHAVRDILGWSERFERGHGMDLYMIRQYQASDSARHVDWKASAKTAQLKTREFAAEESRRIVLAFDRFGRDGDSEAFERLVSEAASAAIYLVRDGAEVSLVADDWMSPSGRSEAQIEPILHYLAMVEMDPASEPPVVVGSDESLQFSLRSPARILQEAHRSAG